MKKRLISLMLAGAMVGAVGTMAGCGYKEETTYYSDYLASEYDGFSEKPVSIREDRIGHNLIVVLTDKLRTLHKADVYLVYRRGYSMGEYITKRVVTNCGEIDRYDDYIQMPIKFPSKDSVDEICEVCFPELAQE